MRLPRVNLKMFFPGMSSKTLNKAISITNKGDFKCDPLLRQPLPQIHHSSFPHLFLKDHLQIRKKVHI